jgi:hypothetical protein
VDDEDEDLFDYTPNVVPVCPQPYAWGEVYGLLKRYALTHPCIPPEPPIPLVLAGWYYSNDHAKMKRWDDTVDWAEFNGCLWAIEAVRPEDMYTTFAVSDYVVGPVGGPMYRDWDYTTKSKPSAGVLIELLDSLKKDWMSVVGKELARSTEPLRFTGRRARRLLVKVTHVSDPPWGDWYALPSDRTKRYEFTKMRRAVNNLFGQQHEVDHIDFL